MTPSRSSPLRMGTASTVRTPSIVFRAIGIFGVGLDIGNVDRSAFERGTGRRAVPSRPNRMLLNPLLQFAESVEGRCHSQHLAVETVDEPALSSA